MGSNAIGYKAVIIDTSIFIKYGMRLESGYLGKLDQFKKSPIQLVFSDIIIFELKQHLIERDQSVITPLKRSLISFKKLYPVYTNEIDKIEKILNGINTSHFSPETRIKSFLGYTGAKVIVSSKYLPVDNLISMYFESKPPFSDARNKKNEFPDAIILTSIEKWANNSDINVLAISIDNDWIQYCSNSDTIDCFQELSRVFELLHSSNEVLDGILQDLAEKLINEEIFPISESLDQYLSNSIESSLIDYSFFSNYEYSEEEVFIMYQGFEFILDKSGNIDLRIIDFIDDKLTVETEIIIYFDYEITMSFWAKDIIDKNYKEIGKKTFNIKQKTESRIFMSLKNVIEGDLNNIKVTEADIIDKNINIDLGSYDPE